MTYVNDNDNCIQNKSAQVCCVTIRSTCIVHVHRLLLTFIKLKENTNDNFSQFIVYTDNIKQMIKQNFSTK